MRVKAAFYWRLLFGASAALFGVVSLLWHGSDLWQRLHAWGLPFAPLLAWGFAIALVAGGVAMPFARAARVAAVVLGVVYGSFTLACISDVIAAPLNSGSYVDFFELLSIVCGAIAAYAATQMDAPRSAALVRAARVGLGICALAFAWAQIAYLKYTASLVPPWVPPNQMFWTILTTAAFGLAAVAILINREAPLAMRLMALMLAIFGVLVWVPTIVAHPATLSNWNELAENYLITAACLLVADVSRSTAIENSGLARGPR